MSCDCCVALLFGATGVSAVCDCGITLNPFSGKNIISCILKGQNACVCLPYLNFSDLLPVTHLFLYLASSVHVSTFRPHKGQVICENLAQKQVKIFEDFVRQGHILLTKCQLS